MVTSEEPKVIPTARYNINETAALLGIHRHTLRSYVKAGFIHPYMPKSRPRELQRLVPRMRFLGSEISRFWIQWV